MKNQTIPYEQTIEQLKSMFVGYDENVIKTVLAANNYEVHATIESLLSMGGGTSSDPPLLYKKEEEESNGMERSSLATPPRRLSGGMNSDALKWNNEFSDSFLKLNENVEDKKQIERDMMLATQLQQELNLEEMRQYQANMPENTSEKNTETRGRRESYPRQQQQQYRASKKNSLNDEAPEMNNYEAYENSKNNNSNNGKKSTFKDKLLSIFKKKKKENNVKNQIYYSEAQPEVIHKEEVISFNRGPSFSSQKSLNAQSLNTQSDAKLINGSKDINEEEEVEILEYTGSRRY